MGIKEPIFILGIGRCGSTIFHDLLSEHEQLAWMSQILSDYPKKPKYNRQVMKLLDFPIINQIIRKRFVPVESYGFWEHLAEGFSEPFRDLVADDVTNKNKKRIREVLSQLTTKKRNRLLIKLTGWSRIRYLNEIFTDAKFIHIMRDGRAVVNSMLHVHFWKGWKGPWNWRWGELSEENKIIWDKYNKSFVALASIEYKIIMDAFENAKKNLSPENYLEIKYEDLCSDTKKIIKQVCNFSNIAYSFKFDKAIGKYNIKSSNNKWHKDLTVEQQDIVGEILEDYLERYNL